MSAYIVDPRTIDYIVQWAHHSSAARDVPVRVSGMRLPEPVQGLVRKGMIADVFYIRLTELDSDLLGQILLAENVRSVRYRYPDAAPDDLPGPLEQGRVWSYHFRPITASKVKPAWVIKACDCLSYQSCETDDWTETLAYKLLQAIREAAISALTDEAPWGITDDDLAKVTA